jgi:hypothetical protein
MMVVLAFAWFGVVAGPQASTSGRLKLLYCAANLLLGRRDLVTWAVHIWWQLFECGDELRGESPVKQPQQMVAPCNMLYRLHRMR